MKQISVSASKLEPGFRQTDVRRRGKKGKVNIGDKTEYPDRFGEFIYYSCMAKCAEIEIWQDKSPIKIGDQDMSDVLYTLRMNLEAVSDILEIEDANKIALIEALDFPVDFTKTAITEKKKAAPTSEKKKKKKKEEEFVSEDSEMMLREKVFLNTISPVLSAFGAFSPYEIPDDMLPRFLINKLKPEGMFLFFCLLFLFLIFKKQLLWMNLFAFSVTKSLR